VKERPIALQGDPEVFGRNVIATVPLLFELGTFFRKNFRQPLHSEGDESIRLLDSSARLVNEGDLHGIPSASHIP
jgi:hypothetical protein